MKPLIGLTMNAVKAHEKHRPSTYGSYYLNFAYAEAIRKAGAVPVALPYGPIDELDTVLNRVDGLVVTGGKDIDPILYGQSLHNETGPVISEKSHWEKELVLKADELDLPLLGICLGLQVVNVSRGGTLHQHVPECSQTVDHPRPMEERRQETHEVLLEKASLLAAICGDEPFMVNSLHHQGVDELGKNLTAVARAKDGLVEGIEDKKRSFLLAVQWHPEDLHRLSRHQALFNALVEACRGN